MKNVRVTLKENESPDALLKRFKKAVQKSGVLDDLKVHQYFLRPQQKRELKQRLKRKNK